MRRPRREYSRLRARDLGGEAMAGILQRPARTALTMLGTIVGVGAFTAILGLTTTTSGQISSDFSVLTSTQVTVNDVGDATELQNPTMDDFPPGSDQLVDRLNGVVAAGTDWTVFTSGQATVSDTDDPYTGSSVPTPVFAASPGYLRAIEPRLASGTLYNAFHDDRRLRVAVLGAAAADQLGITNVSAQPAVFIQGVGYTVIGIIGSDQRAPEDMLGVFIPDQTALAQYGRPSVGNPASMLVETRLGAAGLIASQVPKELRPDEPGLFQSVAPPTPHTLQNTVSGNLDSLFLLLAVLTLIIGTVGIANTTLVAVMERTKEIGLRRALGAKPRHIALQFLTETTLLGAVGGLIGTSFGIATVVIVAVEHHWTAVLDPAATLPAPLIGALTGFAAGAYPALRAARIEPLEALRR
jgi:putative ABC transport system permease protein